MNQKQCKLLRRNMRLLMGVDWKEVKYITPKNKPGTTITMKNGRLHSSVENIKMTPECGRYQYQDMKREYKRNIRG